MTRKSFSQLQRFEDAVRTLATSPKPPRERLELALTSFIVPIVVPPANDKIDQKLAEALRLATKFPALIPGEGTIRGTLRRVQHSTISRISTLIFDAYIQLRDELTNK